mmetsp:Transcript_3448/g.5309  ORF Transcript_3448/g.5309 Transcript_3448/m.5309 type:complete len:96 (-) Transcript_3448:150-437(-)
MIGSAAGRALVGGSSADKAFGVGASLFGIWFAVKAVPWMAKWECLPGYTSDAYKAAEARVRYDNVHHGIVYSPYDDGNVIREMPPQSKGKMILRS